MWTARVAPLDVESSDHRTLAATGPWTLFEPATLRTIEAESRVVGWVETLVARDGFLYATGTVDDFDLAVRMQNRELRPALELGENAQGGPTDAADLDNPAWVWSSGEVRAIALSEAPAWDAVYFEVAL